MTENTTPETTTTGDLNLRFGHMTKAELTEKANDLGIEVPTRWSKNRIIEAITVVEEMEAKGKAADTRDGLPTYDVTYVNEAKGGVSAHIAGCKDLDKVGKGNHDEQAGTVTVTSKHDAWLEYNSDFLAEDPSGDNAWDIDWKNCAKHVPHHDPLNDTEIATAIADLNDTKETPVKTETKTAETKATKTPVKRVEYTPQGTITAKKEYTVSEAAEVMGMSANAMNHWFRRDYFPTEWVTREGSARKVRVVKGADLKAYVKTRAAEKKAKESTKSTGKAADKETAKA